MTSLFALNFFLISIEPGWQNENDKPLISHTECHAPRRMCTVPSFFLQLVDKRRLVNFLQLITDYGMVLASQSAEGTAADDDDALNDM